MSRRLTLAMAVALLLSGCGTTNSRETVPAVGTGWSRAPDLSVYGGMVLAGKLAREQDVLCARQNPALIDSYWRAEFEARETWIANALTNLYGADAVAREANRRVGRATCPTIRDDNWRREHARLLHLLELRLYPREHWRTAG